MPFWALVLRALHCSLMASQSTVKMKYRDGGYKDLGLVFARDDPGKFLGCPLQSPNLGKEWLDPLLAKAELPHIRVHDARHCCASLMIQNGEHTETIAARLGHSNSGITQRIYSHLMPGMQREAANRLGAVLHG